MVSRVVRSGVRLEALVWDCSRLGLPLRFEYARWMPGLPAQGSIGPSCVILQEAWSWVKPPKQPHEYLSPARFSRTLPYEFAKPRRQGGDWVATFVIGWMVGDAIFDDD